MLIYKEIKVTIEGKSAKVTALFDSGSVFTLMGYERLRELFNEVKVKKLTRPREGGLLNGQKIIVDGYVDSQIFIGDYLVEDRIYLSKDIVKEIIVEDKKRPLPDLIIGAPTLEVGGLGLDLTKGEIIWRGTLIL